jgi:hypothetical protein
MPASPNSLQVNQDSLETLTLPAEVKTRSVASRQLSFTKESARHDASRFPMFNTFNQASSVLGISPLASFSDDDDGAVHTAPASPTVMHINNHSATKRIRLGSSTSLSSGPSIRLADRLKASYEAPEGSLNKSAARAQLSAANDPDDESSLFSEDDMSTAASAGSKEPLSTDRN